MTTEEFLDRERERKLDVIRREYEREKKILDLPIVTREVFRRANAYKTALDAAEGKPTSKEWTEEALTFLYEEYAYYSTCLDLSKDMEWAEEYQEREELLSFMIALIEREPTVAVMNDRTPFSLENGSESERTKKGGNIRCM